MLVLLKVLPETRMDPGVVLMVFLPILIFQGALSADATSLRQAARPILALAVPGVAMSLLATAAVASWEIGLPFSVALLLGAILAITDTVSVLLAFRSVRVPHRLAAIMEGESLFNDGTALVLVGVAATVVAQGFVDVPRDRADAVRRHRRRRRARRHVRDARHAGAAPRARRPDGGPGLGRRRLRHRRSSAEHFHGSPVIAVVVAGVLIGHEMRARLEPSRVLALQGFWEIAAFVINVWLFLLVGIQLSAEMLLREAWPIALAVIALHVGRAVAVYGMLRRAAPRRRRRARGAGST